jgi:hypothetical protein
MYPYVCLATCASLVAFIGLISVVCQKNSTSVNLNMPPAPQWRLSWRKFPSPL